VRCDKTSIREKSESESEKIDLMGFWRKITLK